MAKFKYTEPTRVKINDFLKQLNPPKPLNSQHDLLTRMIKIGYENKVPFMDKLISEIARVEQRAGIKVRDHLGFGSDTNAVIKYYLDEDGDHYMGEMSGDNRHGRGINISSYGNICIGYWQNDDRAPGNYIEIDSDGEFRVGECYMQNGNIKVRGTEYKTDGTSKKYDR